MMKQMFRVSVVAVGLMLVSSGAFAQALPWEGRGLFNVNFGMQIASQNATTSTQTFPLYDETGKVTSAQQIDSQSPYFDIGGGFRVAGNFGVGFAYSRLSTTGKAVVTAQVPHPLLYEQPRTATATVDALEHLEQGFHFQVLWLLPISDKLDVTFSAGPSMFRLNQGSVSTPTITEVGPPYTSVNMTTKTVTTTGSRIGFNIGADLAYHITNTLGVGAQLRYAAATFNLEPEPGATLSVKAGGFQFGGGLRVRF
jgi:hypothetical protein